ncbi:hypothetical protein RI367_000435 [Sorochytrium milnesiophthora]
MTSRTLAANSSRLALTWRRRVRVFMRFTPTWTKAVLAIIVLLALCNAFSALSTSNDQTTAETKQELASQPDHAQLKSAAGNPVYKDATISEPAGKSDQAHRKSSVSEEGGTAVQKSKNNGDTAPRSKSKANGASPPPPSSRTSAADRVVPKSQINETLVNGAYDRVSTHPKVQQPSKQTSAAALDIHRRLVFNRFFCFRSDGRNWTLPDGVWCDSSAPASKSVSALPNIFERRRSNSVQERFCGAKDGAYLETLKQRYSAASSQVTTTPLFIALNLYNNEKELPDILTSFVAFLRFLHVSSPNALSGVYISVYENGSDDGTKDVLRQFSSYLEALHVNHTMYIDDRAKPHWVHRIEYLSEVRNHAILPLVENISPPSLTAPNMYSARMYDRTTGEQVKQTALLRDTVSFGKVLFLNDIYYCHDELLELLHQSYQQQSDMTCGVDYDGGNQPVFYDTWVTRDSRGEQWDKQPLDNHVRTSDGDNHDKALRQQPFQAHCCWNGAAVLNPSPFIKDNIRFRFGSHGNGECPGSEVTTLCRDFYLHKYNRTAIVPRFKVAYDLDTFSALKVNSQFANTYPRDRAFTAADDAPVAFAPPPKTQWCIPMFAANNRSPDETQSYAEDISALSPAQDQP